MKFILVLAFVVGVAYCAPAGETEIVKYENENNGIEGYKFGYETSDGVKREEVGTIKNAGTENEALTVSGKISWVGPDGITYTIEFIADENGFQPKGDHIPK